jgi:hypothetical protein
MSFIDEDYKWEELLRAEAQLRQPHGSRLRRLMALLERTA